MEKELKSHDVQEPRHKNSEVTKLIKKVSIYKKNLIQKYHLKKIGVFGSYVRGEETGKSDVDVLVEFAEPISLFEFMDLEEELTEILGLNVDLVSKKALKPRIGRQILKEVIYI